MSQQSKSGAAKRQAAFAARKKASGLKNEPLLVF